MKRKMQVKQEAVKVKCKHDQEFVESPETDTGLHD